MYLLSSFTALSNERVSKLKESDMEIKPTAESLSEPHVARRLR